MGLNTSHKRNEESIVWYRMPLQESDEFTVKAKSISKNSVPLESKMRDQKTEDERKIEPYQSLKKELEEEWIDLETVYILCMHITIAS